MSALDIILIVVGSLVVICFLIFELLKFKKDKKTDKRKDFEE